MSELKAISGHEIREDIDYNTRGIDPEDKEWCKYGKELCDTLYYLKSEADKVIEELKNQRDGAFGLANLGLTLDDLSQMSKKEIDRQKYKRCLAMASYWLAVSYQCVDDKHRQNAERHHRKWLDIAKRFEEAK